MTKIKRGIKPGMKYISSRVAGGLWDEFVKESESVGHDRQKAISLALYAYIQMTPSRRVAIFSEMMKKHGGS